MAKEHTLISDSATVGVLLTLTDNSNYFSECAFRSLPNVSWQIIKKTSGLFDSATKYKSVFLATIKGGASFVQVKFSSCGEGESEGEETEGGGGAGKKKVCSRAARSGKSRGLR